MIGSLEVVVAIIQIVKKKKTSTDYMNEFQMWVLCIYDVGFWWIDLVVAFALL